jgi:hypothetical protein
MSKPPRLAKLVSAGAAVVAGVLLGFDQARWALLVLVVGALLFLAIARVGNEGRGSDGSRTGR